MRSRHNPLDRKRRRATGLTLVEVIVVVVILTIVAAVVVPHMVGGSDLQVTSAARMIATDLQYAQDYAITMQDPVTVTFDVSADSYALSNTSGDLNHPISKSAYQMDFSSQDGFAGVSLNSADFGGNAAVTFDEMGAPDSAGSVVVQAGGYSYEVNVAAATGKVTVSRP